MTRSDSRADRLCARRGVDAKRAFDVAASGAALVLISPVLAAIAVMVRLDSRGPAYFRQERVGLHGQPFKIHKFRTMCVGSAGSLISPTSDPRITRIGAALRRSKLDELPQLLDVLSGRMSLVGPRPEVPKYVALWTRADRRVILSVRPGITDPASIAMRNEADVLRDAHDPEQHYVTSLMPQKTAMYVEYVRTRSFTGDLRLIATTLRAVITK